MKNVFGLPLPLKISRNKKFFIGVVLLVVFLFFVHFVPPLTNSQNVDAVVPLGLTHLNSADEEQPVHSEKNSISHVSVKSNNYKSNHSWSPLLFARNYDHLPVTPPLIHPQININNLLFIGILSQHSTADRRNAQRKTWIKDYEGSILSPGTPEDEYNKIVSNENFSKVKWTYRFIVGHPQLDDWDKVSEARSVDLVLNRPKELVYLHHYCRGLKNNNQSSLLDSYKSICEESYIHKDILLVPCGEGYYDLSCKVIYLFERASLLLPGLGHILKCDDDAYIRVDPMYHYLNNDLKNKKGLTNIYTGMYYGHFSPIRSPVGSRYYISRITFPDDNGPEYLSGSGHVISIDIINQIIKLLISEEETIKNRIWGKEAFSFNKIKNDEVAFETEKKKLIITFPFEDVNIGIIMKQLGVSLHHDGRFVWHALQACDPSFLLMHYVQPKTMEYIHQAIHKNIDICQHIRTQT